MGLIKSNEVRIWNGSVYNDIDTTSRALEVIDSYHAKIHDGNTFIVNDSVSGLVTGGSRLIYFGVGSTNIHAITKFVTDGNVSVDFFEGVTVSASGTAITPVNKNRTSSLTTNSKFYYAPTVTSSGTLMFKDYVLGGPGNGQGIISTYVGGANTQRNEWVLKAGSNYMFQIFNSTGSSIYTTSNIELYE